MKFLDNVNCFKIIVAQYLTLSVSLECHNRQNCNTMFPILTLYNNNGKKPPRDGYGKDGKEKTDVSLEAEVRLLKMDNVNQCCMKNTRGETMWKLCSIVKYETEESYYIKVFEM